MTADEIQEKTGIEERRYTERRLEHISLQAAHAALEGAGRRPEEIGAVIFCSCTSTRLIPSVATWLSGQLGIFQTHGSFDLIAACAGFPYGLAEAVRLLQEVKRPVLVVCAEKFSDKIGSVRPSRMIFGDGASALVVGPAADGAPPDVEVVQTYASGPVSQVNSIIWPNPEFDNNITVYGPEVKALVERYLDQMMGELRALPVPRRRPARCSTPSTSSCRTRPTRRWSPNRRPRPASTRRPLLQRREGRQRLRRQHPDRDPRRRPGGRRSTARCACSRRRSGPARWAATRSSASTPPSSFPSRLRPPTRWPTRKGTRPLRWKMSERPSAADAPLRRVAIVNRGEAAVRLIRAVRELNLEHGWGTRTIALHTEAERRAMFVREADEAVLIAGPRPYRDHGELERALRASGADAAWVGWGFVAEDPAFAELCERNGIVFIGPPPDVIRRLGDETGVKRLAEQAGLRVDAATAEDAAVPGAHRVDVQVFADDHGAVWAAGARDCSIQRGSRKLIEESSSPVLGAEQERELRAAAVDLARSVGYRNAGTVEFLYHPDERAFVFTGSHRVPAGRAPRHRDDDGARPGEAAAPRRRRRAPGGRAADRRPATRSRPGSTPRTPSAASPPRPEPSSCSPCRPGPGCASRRALRWATASPPDYDATIAKVIGWGRDRAEARARLRRALAETTVVLRAGTTNRASCSTCSTARRWSPERPTPAGSTASSPPTATSRPVTPTSRCSPPPSTSTTPSRSSSAAPSTPLPARGRPQASDEIGRTVDLDHRGRSYRLAVATDGSPPLPDRGRWRDGRRAGRAPPALRAPAGDRRRRVDGPLGDRRPGSDGRGRRSHPSCVARAGRRRARPCAGTRRGHHRRRGRRGGGRVDRSRSSRR